MANRSYLYTCDQVPTDESTDAPRGLSELNYDIPLIHMLMAANNPRRVQSAIWSEHDIAILADREHAIERALAFADKVGAGTLDDRAAWDSDLAAMREFFAKVPPSKYVLLECGEIWEMQCDSLDAIKAAADKLVTDCQATGARVDRALAGKEDTWLDEVRTEWQRHFGASWSEHLYFSFGDQ
ncbi:MAG TPA: hypothetical protein VMZ53_05005 [Kofleriaceae bacterium]|nr:hypothetical protein [Kofleriaceae bacterium]